MAESFLESIGTAELLPIKYQEGYDAGRASMADEYNRGYNAGYAAGAASSSPSSGGLYIPEMILDLSNYSPNATIRSYTTTGPNRSGTMHLSYRFNVVDTTSTGIHHDLSASYSTTGSFRFGYISLQLSRSGNSYSIRIVLNESSTRSFYFSAVVAFI